jgi:hypothetical protein
MMVDDVRVYPRHISKHDQTGKSSTIWRTPSNCLLALSCDDSSGLWMMLGLDGKFWRFE